MREDDTVYAAARRAALAGLEQLTHAIGADARRDLARKHAAFRRARVIPDADSLLLLVLFYTHAQLSLRVTLWFACVALGLEITDSSLGERFRACGPWLRALVLGQLAARARLSVRCRTRLMIVDGSVLCRPGASGTEWRVHVVFDPGASEPTSVEVTDAHGAEGLDQGKYGALALVMGDRNYGRYREFQTARERSVALLARTSLQSQAVRDAAGHPVAPRAWADAADRGATDHVVQLARGDDPLLAARLIIVPLPAEAANRARQKVNKAAQKKGRMPDRNALHLAGYLCLLTTCTPEQLSVEEACALYRVRWQVECFLKRAKSIGKLGAIVGGPKLVETQIWARLLSLCGLDAGRPAPANECAAAGTRTARPPALWRWLQVQRMIWSAPLVMLAAIGAADVSVEEQDAALRERRRRRGRRNLLDAFPFLAPAAT